MITPPLPESPPTKEVECDLKKELLSREILPLVVVRVISPPFPDEAADSECDLKNEPLFREILPLLVARLIAPAFPDSELDLKYETLSREILPLVVVRVIAPPFPNKLVSDSKNAPLARDILPV